MNRLEAGVIEKLNQWDMEAAICACRAFRRGGAGAAVMVTYPTGLSMMRFAEPLSGCPAWGEVTVEVWTEIVKNNGKLYS